MQYVFYGKRKNIPVLGSYDAIVVGSGPSGIGAAVTAGRNGGISTSGLMSHWTGSVNSRLYEEILQRAADKNPFNTGVRQIEIDPELLKNVYYEMLEEANVEILLYSLVCDVITEDNTVKGVIVQNKTHIMQKPLLTVQAMVMPHITAVRSISRAERETE